MTKIKNHLLYWKLAYFRAFLSMMIVGGVSWGISTASISGGQWAAMSSFERFGIYVGIAVLMGKDLLSFLDKTMSRMDGGAPEPEPDAKERAADDLIRAARYAAAQAAPQTLVESPHPETETSVTPKGP
jgi:hypothetical protein